MGVGGVVEREAPEREVDMKRMRCVGLVATVGALVLCCGAGVGKADELAKLMAMDRQARDNFGFSVAISGDCALVGAPNEDTLADDAGAAYVFRFNGTYWIEEAKLTASDGGISDAFGVSVALSGDYALVGAAGARVGDTQNAGAVYAFHFNGTEWSQTGKLTASVPTNNDNFGCCVATNGALVVIGAWGDDSKGLDAGAAYVFRRSGVTWLQLQKFVAPDGEEDDSFGIAVAIDDSWLIIGASGDNDYGNDSGSAYIYAGRFGTWSLQQKLIAPDGVVDQQFGRSVAVQGSQVVVGAPGDQDVGYFSGAAYGFAWTGTTWAGTTKMKPIDVGPGDSFGQTVSLTETSALIGARGEHAAYIFGWDASNWSQRSKIQDTFGGNNDVYAFSLGVDGDHAIVGAPGDDNDSGSAYIYDGLSIQIAPIYRFWSPIFNNHFYTISQAERNHILETWPLIWGYEEISYYAYPCDSAEGLIPIYRFWSGQLASHFYTADPQERDSVQAHYPDTWTYEGIVFYAFALDDHPVGTVPVYRFWSEALAAHFYTARESEKNDLINRPEWGWEYEGIAWYAYAP